MQLKWRQDTSLKERRPADYELVVNLKTAKALAWKFRQLLARADEVIE